VQSSPSPPAEDPAIAEQTRIERERAEADRLKATREQLTAETATNTARFGKRSSLLSSGQVGFRSILGGG
jgi:hypothetical protein